MHIVGYQEFIKLPRPVYYSQIGRGGLFRREEVIYDYNRPIDFFEKTIVPLTNGEDIDAVGSIGRWGEFDYDARFCVFDGFELDQMARLINLE